MPNTVFGSKVADFFNFKTDEALDDDAIFVTISSDSLNAINAIRSGRDLQIFTSSAEFFIPQSTLDPITPTNIVIKTATRRGSKRGHTARVSRNRNPLHTKSPVKPSESLYLVILI